MRNGKKLWRTILLILAVSLVFSPVAQAATDDEIEAAITDGIAYLVGQQQAAGFWSDDTSYEFIASTCFALLKLEERAYELGYDSPFDPDYPYWENVVAGWQYVFNSSRTVKQTPLGTQDHTGGGATGTVDDPDTNGNGYGVYFGGPIESVRPVSTTGVCLMALEASGTPDRANDGGLDFDSNGTDTFKELAQEAARLQTGWPGPRPIPGSARAAGAIRPSTTQLVITLPISPTPVSLRWAWQLQRPSVARFPPG